MSKKRKRRQTPDDMALHREAARIRSMPDKQLVAQFHRAAEPQEARVAPQAAHNAADGDAAATTLSPVEQLVAALSDGKCKGIRGATAFKVGQFAAEMGLM